MTNGSGEPKGQLGKVRCEGKAPYFQLLLSDFAVIIPDESLSMIPLNDTSTARRYDKWPHRLDNESTEPQP